LDPYWIEEVKNANRSNRQFGSGTKSF